MQVIPTPTGKIDSNSSKMMVSGEVQSTITFTNDRPCEPLPPLVQALYTSSSNNLEVSAVIFLAQEEDPESIYVTYEIAKDGTPNFMINYNDAEIEAKTFYGYQVNFNITIENQPNVIEAFVNDIDPKTSRGTIVTVQS